MAQGLNYEGQESILQVFFRGSSQPDSTAEEFTVRLANPLLLRVTDTNLSGWVVGETAEGSSSGDTGVIEDKRLNGDGSVTLKLSGVGETEVFSLGENLVGQSSGESGAVSNGNINLVSISSGDFVPNEGIEDQSTGATADIKTVHGSVIEINNVSGTFGVGNSISGQESGATATINKHYAGMPGLFPSDGIGDVVTEADTSIYTPQTLSANATDWPTKDTDITGDYYLETKNLTFDAGGGSLGPINLAILTVNIDTSGETIISASPLQGTPPSKVIESGGSISLRYQQALGV